MSMILLGLDPGKTTGWALIKIENKKIMPLGMGHDKDESMLSQLENIRRADKVIVEDFLLDPKLARAGRLNYNNMPASQVIGSIKTLCATEGKPCVLQSRSIKPVGYGWMNKKYVKNKPHMHQWDALAHVVYFAVRSLGANPVKT